MSITTLLLNEVIDNSYKSENKYDLVSGLRYICDSQFLSDDSKKRLIEQIVTYSNECDLELSVISVKIADELRAGAGLREVMKMLGKKYG